ncbi:alpha-L-glutamate ligase [Paraliobacillus quinghaiensis]|uniref:Alpha-L-glutamate ligase n=1 Tax=Paraliobacillus quinghaiensis TaxID=470815 RepID=A0A917WT77_9BACI|nr:RimK family alpha-L-glutamate ligase [Paraliobacillus quinghaiensis]GGM27233.1 alpha-L-glutamate ligase [Paraliobacillus quinghaiensis]
MYGWVIYNGHLTGNKFITFSKWIQYAGEKEGIDIKLKRNDQVLPIVSSNGLGLLDHDQFPAFVIFIDKDIVLARQLELLGIPVFNSANAIELCDNKVLMYQALGQKKLAIPLTIIAPKIFTGSKINSENFLHIEKSFDYPMIIKEGYGSYGEQVYLIENRTQLIEKINQVHDRPFVFQEFIKSSYGQDIRIYVVGDEVVASVKRVAENDFRANAQLGSTMEAYQPTRKEKELAIQATRALGTDFAGVDLLIGANGEPIICEINTNAHIENIYKYTGVNIAEHIISHIKLELNC